MTKSNNINIQRKIDFKNIFLKISIAILLIICISIPRISASNLYSPLEDELLAIQHNLNNSPQKLFFEAPDVTHPGLWYIIMEIPITYLGHYSPIVYYRLFNIFLFTSLCVISWIFLRKRFGASFWIFFFGLLLSNIYLIHLTFQNRMYALVLGISIIYSLFWLKIIEANNKPSKKTLIILSLIASAGFFTNYSFVWILPIWPLTYLITHKRIKPILFFIFLLFIETFWFLPTFIRNSLQSVENNQWAPQLGLVSIKELIKNYFGITITEDWIFFSFLLISLSPLLLEKNKNRKIFFSLIFGFVLYFVAIAISGSSLLYARVSIPIVIIIYVLLAKIYSKNRNFFKTFLLLLPLLIIQLVQVVNYFEYKYPNQQNLGNWNYHVNPLTIIQNYPFEKNSCLIGIPHWNYFPISYFAKEMPNLSIINHNVIKSDFKASLSKCNNLYIIIQSSVPSEIIEIDVEVLKENDLFCNQLLKSFENQNLYHCTNQNL